MINEHGFIFVWKCFSDKKHFHFNNHFLTLISIEPFFSQTLWEEDMNEKCIFEIETDTSCWDNFLFEGKYT